MEKIFIRSLLPGDEEALFRIYSDMGLCLSSGARPVTDMAGAKEKLNNYEIPIRIAYVIGFGDDEFPISNLDRKKAG